LLVAGVALAGIGASVARAETPAQKITRLRNQAAEVQATIDRMNDQVETLVEQYNANQEALQATLDRQRDTARRLDEARKRLGSAENLMGDRVRAIYMGGPVTGLEQLLEVRSVADAVTVTQYQQTATASDVQAITNVRQSRQELASVVTTLGAQRREQEQLQAKLNGQRDDIEGRLSQQRHFLDRLSADVKRSVAEDQRRQEELRQQAIARELAAERATRAEAARRAAAEKAARERAAKEAAARAASQPSTPASAGGSGGSGTRSSPSTGGSVSRATSKTSPGSTSTSRSSSTSRAPSSHQASSSSSTPTSAARQAVAFARAQLGKPYIWGGNGPTGFDCSGLTMKAWQSAGVSIPRTASRQYTIGRHISGVSNLEPGDLVFFGSPIHHVGMYIGNGMMIEAPYTGAQIRIRSMNRSDYVGATRPTG